MRKSYVNNTFCLFGAALALSLKSTLAGAGPVSEPMPTLTCDAPVPYAKLAAGSPATAPAQPAERRG